MKPIEATITRLTIINAINETFTYECATESEFECYEEPIIVERLDAIIETIIYECEIECEVEIEIKST